MSETQDSLDPQPVVFTNLDNHPQGERKEVVIENEKIVLFNVEGECFAVSAVCPHRAGPLIRGTLDEHKLGCPMHGWVFDIRTGDSNGRPHNLDVFPIRCEHGRLYTDL